MCGIAGLHLRDESLFPRLGGLLQTMVCTAAFRGTDAAGIGIYDDPTLTPPGKSAVAVLLDVSDPTDFDDARLAVTRRLPDAQVRSLGPTTVVTSSVSTDDLVAGVRSALPDIVVTSYGNHLAVLKGTGHPADLATTFDLEHVRGTQGIVHTRMATESAVTPAASHPFSVGPDQCFVHNGSFSNHNTIRRELQAEGISFDTENDSEVGARFVAAQLEGGADLEKALRLVCERFDGFYTLLVSTADSMAIVRDAISCKPAVVAETDAWVAVASEYRYLTDLPGISDARLFEPRPEEVYLWTR